MDLKVGEQFVSILVLGKKRFLDVRRVNRVCIERGRERDVEREDCEVGTRTVLLTTRNVLPA